MDFSRYIRFIRPMAQASLVAAWTAAVTAPLVALPAGRLIGDGISTGVLFAGLWMLLREVVRFADRIPMSAPQRAIGHGMLALLFCVCWVGGQLLMLYTALPRGEFGLFLPTVPVRIVVALLVYGWAARGPASRRDELCGAEPVLFSKEGWPDVSDPKASPAGEAAPATDASAIQAEDVPVVGDVEPIDHVAVRSGQKIELILVSEIQAVLSDGDYVAICTGDGRYLKELTMKYFADRLPKGQFARIHRSAIVRLGSIVRIEAYDRQRQTVTLRNGLQVRASEPGYRELRKALNL